MQDLFGNEIQVKDLISNNAPERKSVRAHKVLIALYGVAENKTCKGCKHFIYRGAGNRHYPKCLLSGLTGHTAHHDWSKKWQACGKYEEVKEKL